ncbi:MAG: type I-E CRISPR-associated protein Cse1/CasA [Chloroflexi bacterium RBG_13_53_26]|nr:MAG: type I-E CRISPR-associated protein Cse1/CasA [Chloroflexi bacterium RBG_13_53_26]
MNSFNLVDQKWIPCIMLDGTCDEKSIKEVILEASDIKEIFDNSPLVTVALHRLLLAILHRNLGPANENEWGFLWNNGSGEWDTDRILTYLDKWHHRFDLFDNKYPFYQCSAMPISTTDAKGKPKSYARPIANLIHELVTGDNATLFDHTNEDNPPAISPPEAARSLVAFQAFAVGGLITFESGQDRTKFGSADNAPLVKGAVSLVQGENLLQTLMLNLHKYNRYDGEPFESKPDDLPIWERNDETLAIDRYPKGYLDLLTWQSRRIRLIPGQDNTGQSIIKQVVIMKGNQFPDGYSLHNKEPMLAFRKILKPGKGQDPWPPVAFQEDKALWRNSVNLFQSVEEERARLKILGWVSDLVEEDKLPRQAVYNLALMGLVTSKAKISLWRHERLPLPLQYLEDEDLVDALKEALELAEDVGKLLGSGFIEIEITDKKGKRKTIRVPSPLRILASELLLKDQNGKTDPDAAKTLTESLSPSRPFWAALGIAFNRFMLDLAADKSEGRINSLQWWAKEIRKAASNAFEETARGLDRTGRTLKAVSKAENEFKKRLYDILKPYINETTEGGE